MSQVDFSDQLLQWFYGSFDIQSIRLSRTAYGLYVQAFGVDGKMYAYTTIRIGILQTLLAIRTHFDYSVDIDLADGLVDEIDALSPDKGDIIGLLLVDNTSAIKYGLLFPLLQEMLRLREEVKSQKLIVEEFISSWNSK